MAQVHYHCDACNHRSEHLQRPGYCAHCGGPLTFGYDQAAMTPQPALPGIWRYAARLPIADPAAAVSLGEGNTPLLAARLDLGVRLFWKDETRNPTGSAKDRALAVAISKGRELGKRRVIIASTGSAGLSAAAYAARAGLAAAVLMPHGTPRDRAAVMHLFGADVMIISGSFEVIADVVERARKQYGWYEVTTARERNPFQAEGPKTIAYELVEQLAGVPDAVVVPTGGGGTLSGIWRGFQELHAAGAIPTLPRMYAVQNVHFNALERALRLGLTETHEIAALGIDSSRPTATPNLKHAVPPDWRSALRALRESEGDVVTVTDAEAIAGQAELAHHEGLFAEVSCAVVAPAIRRLLERGLVQPSERVVGMLSGSGLRDIAALAEHHPAAIRTLTPQESLTWLGHP
jgi:threonine synthase